MCNHKLIPYFLVFKYLVIYSFNFVIKSIEDLYENQLRLMWFPL